MSFLGDSQVGPIIHLHRLSKAYRNGREPLPVLYDLDLTIHDGEFVAIMGPSGSGKSTLLNILGLLDDYDTGEYYLDGQLMQNLSETQAAQYRNRSLGFVFQSFNLLPFKTAWENVALPLWYQGVSRKEREAKARTALERLGLADRTDHYPDQLSGGQKQRVAITRVGLSDGMHIEILSGLSEGEQVKLPVLSLP